MNAPDYDARGMKIVANLSFTMGGMNRRRRKKLQKRLVTAAGRVEVGRVVGLLRTGADPNLPDPDGTRPLYRASVQNAVDNVRVLLAAGADPNLESGTREEGFPLCAAACHGHIDTVRELLAAGADPNLREDNGEGWTATEWARAGNHRRTLDVLLAATEACTHDGYGEACG
jgi:hypothetical protein